MWSKYFLLFKSQNIVLVSSCNYLDYPSAVLVDTKATVAIAITLRHCKDMALNNYFRVN